MPDGEERQVIDLAWLALQPPFQGETDHDGFKLADRLYAYMEEVAREHPDSTEDMPVHLVCEIQNTRGLRFWQRMGFRQIGLVQVPDGPTYLRMVRP
jgi:GNAT superfamily N-acetyltransferase